MYNYETCTTTSTTAARTTTSPTTRERLLPSMILNHPEMHASRYNPETTTAMRCPCMYEMHPCFASSLNYRCTFPLFCLATDMWELGIRDHPTISSMFRTSARFSLASVSQSSYRNRYAVVAPFSDMLPWHHFRICCRGTISVSPPWHPFHSAMATNAS